MHSSKWTYSEQTWFVQAFHMALSCSELHMFQFFGLRFMHVQAVNTLKNAGRWV